MLALRLRSGLLMALISTVSATCPDILNGPPKLEFSSFPTHFTDAIVYEEAGERGMQNVSINFCDPWLSPEASALCPTLLPAFINEWTAACVTTSFTALSVPWSWNGSAIIGQYKAVGIPVYANVTIVCNITSNAPLAIAGDTVRLVGDGNNYLWLFDLTSSVVCQGTEAPTTAKPSTMAPTTSQPDSPIPPTSSHAPTPPAIPTPSPPVTSTAVPTNVPPTTTVVPAHICSRHVTCLGCTQETTTECGWCDTTLSCAPGSSLGPSSGSCVSWDFAPNECPPPPTTTSSPSDCRQWTSCHSCIHAPSYNCGWCATTSTCSIGTLSGPTVGQCSASSWYYDLGSCPHSTPSPPSSSCGGYASCSTCTGAAEGDCGWCDGLFCTKGTSSGPDSGSCFSWGWLEDQCAVPCHHWTSCSNCTSASTYDCGWCSSTGTCSIGTSSGPNSGSCSASDWIWLVTSCPNNAVLN